jgi:hypothetical protein
MRMKAPASTIYKLSGIDLSLLGTILVLLMKQPSIQASQFYALTRTQKVGTILKVTTRAAASSQAETAVLTKIAEVSPRVKMRCLPLA